MSERTPMEALRSALRFAASRSCITSAEELAIMDAWNNTRPQPSAEPVAVWREALKQYAYGVPEALEPSTGNDQEAAFVIASALEAARREALEQAAGVAESRYADTGWNGHFKQGGPPSPPPSAPSRRTPMQDDLIERLRIGLDICLFEGSPVNRTMSEAADRIAALEAENARLTGLKPGEYGWLIEHMKATLWYTLTNSCREWTADSTAALRFARKQDAEAYIARNSIRDGRATEHRWD